MNYRIIGRVLGLILLCLAAFMLLPLIAGLCYGENVMNFAVSILAAAVPGFILTRIKPKRTGIFAREGFVIVGLGWLLMSLLGALPFVISGSIPSYIDAVFETVSGFTTTGATILTDVESLPRGDMFWRLFTHWIGGMGVLVFIMAVLPMSGEHSMHIMRAEVPGPTVGKLVPRVRKTASILYLIYIGLTVAETIFLLFGGMNFYEALLHAFATAGTGGFSTRAASIGAFNSPYIEMVIAVFMLLFGVNFNLYFLLFLGRVKDVLKNEELHWYLGIVLFSVLMIAAGIMDRYGALGALRQAFFNVAAIISTTGFGTEDFTRWPAYCQWIIVMLMFVGGCAGSTGGGLKVSRVMTLTKNIGMETRRMVRPQTVCRVQIDGKRVDSGTVRAITVFFSFYMLILLLTTFLVSFDGYDVLTCFTASLSCLSNIGPGLSLVGPAGNFAIFSGPVKIVLSATMLIGRLEIYPILVLLLPRTWKS